MIKIKHRCWMSAVSGLLVSQALLAQDQSDIGFRYPLAASSVFSSGVRLPIVADIKNAQEINHIEFFANGNSLGKDFFSPYMATIESFSSGQTTLRLVAYHTNGEIITLRRSIRTEDFDAEKPWFIDDLTAQNPQCGEINLQWTDVPNAQAYRVRRKRPGDATYTNLYDVLPGVQSFTDLSAIGDVEYQYMVRPMYLGKAANISTLPVITNFCDGVPPEEPEPLDPNDDGIRKTATNFYAEQNGLVIMEIENTDSDYGLWQLNTFLEGYRGKGHLEFTGNNQSSGPPGSPLDFTFKINEGGIYRLTFRAHKRLDGAEPDKSNDAYVRVKGDYGAHPNAGDNHQDPAQLWDLQRSVKLFGGSANGFGYTATLDLGGEGNKRQPLYEFKSGETYRLTVSGRSQNFNVDRIIFHKLSQYSSFQVQQTLGIPETVTEEPIGSPSPNRELGYDCPVHEGEEPLWQGKGRIVVSSDGNEHDKDDWAATPMTLALLAGQGLQDKLALYTYSDHIWGSDHDFDGSDGNPTASEQMRESAETGKQIFGFDNSTFIEAVADPDGAVAAMVEQINQSSEEDPLFIVAAGPMEVVGRAIAASNPEKLPYVTILSHSNWNNNHADRPSSWEDHSGWTYAEIRSNFAPLGLNVVQIVDQNGEAGHDGLRAHTFKFEWINQSTHPAMQWLYRRLESAKKGVDFDPSDAGMIIYLLTGIEETDPCLAIPLMETFLTAS